MTYIVALGVGFKCPRKIRLNTQCPPPKKKNFPELLKLFLTLILSIFLVHALYCKKRHKSFNFGHDNMTLQYRV